MTTTFTKILSTVTKFLTGPDNAFWFQPEWHVNATTGSDENDGKTASSPLQTFDEVAKRLGPNPILQQNTTIFFESAALAAGDQVALASCRGVAGSTTLIFTGLVTRGATLGAITAVSQINHGVADGALKVTIGAIVWPARRTRVRIVGGPRDGAIAYVVGPNIGAGQSRLSPFTTNAGLLPTIVAPQIGDVLAVETVTSVPKPLLLLSNAIKFTMKDIEFLDDGSGQMADHVAEVLPVFKQCAFHGTVRAQSVIGSILFNGCVFDATNAGVFSTGPNPNNILACFVDSTNGSGIEGFWQVDLDTIIDGGGTGGGINSNYGYITVVGDVAIYSTQAGHGALFVQVGSKLTNKPIFAGSTLYGTGNSFVWEVTGGSQVWISDTTKTKIVGTTNHALFSGAAAAGPLIALDAFGNAIYQLDPGS